MAASRLAKNWAGVGGRAGRLCKPQKPGRDALTRRPSRARYTDSKTVSDRDSGMRTVPGTRTQADALTSLNPHCKLCPRVLIPESMSGTQVTMWIQTGGQYFGDLGPGFWESGANILGTSAKIGAKTRNILWSNFQQIIQNCQEKTLKKNNKSTKFAKSKNSKKSKKKKTRLRSPLP